MEALEPISPAANRLRCSVVTEESRRTTSYPPFFTYSEVMLCGTINDNSVSNLLRDRRIDFPKEPCRPTSKTLGQETVVALSMGKAKVELLSNGPSTKWT